MAQYIVNATDLNVRPAPGLDNTPIGVIYKGTKVEVLKQENEWYYVKIAVQSDDFVGSIEGWVSSKYLDPAETARTRFTLDTDLKESKSPLSAHLINEYLKHKPGLMQGIGEVVIAAAQKYRINPTYIVAHAILESDWGKSPIAMRKNNLFGYGADDNDPMGGALPFDSVPDCVDFVMGKVAVNYLDPRGKYFVEAPCLGTKSYGMNVYYASDPDWGEKIAAIGRTMEEWAAAFNPPHDQEPARFKLLDAVDLINPEKPYYQPRDIDNIPGRETFCNWFAGDVLDVMGIKLPRYDSSAGFYPRPHPYYGNTKMTKPYSAGHLNRYFNNGGEGKWKSVGNKADVVKLANDDKVVVASIPGSPGHIAVVIPGGTGSSVLVAQAGAVCSKKLPLAQGFGNADVQFFQYVG
jgi:hypothetical protein